MDNKRNCLCFFISFILMGSGQHSMYILNFCYNHKNKGFRLNATIFSTVHVSQKLDCLIVCDREPCCRSINFKTEWNSNIEKNCELLHNVVYNNSEKLLEPNPSFDHLYFPDSEKEYNASCLTIQGPGKCSLSNHSCHTNARCTDAVDGSYHCQCQAGYHGDGYNCTDIGTLIDKLHQPRTCSALLKKHPSTPSGMYYINPEGFNSSLLVRVYCNMTSKDSVGVTTIGHDSESRTLVNGYESHGSYKKTIKYNIPVKQIVAIVNQSKNCEQFIKYECYHSTLLVENPYGWWVSRQGSKMNYWGGAAVNSGKCACGMTNSCAGGHKCNCDKNDNKWRKDSGYLTDMNTLPVTELRFGDTGTSDNNEKGYHTLGKLRCWS